MFSSMRSRVGALALAAALSSPAIAQGATISHSASHPLAPTNWNGTLSIPLFDPGLGTLLSVTVTLDGHCEGTAKFESLDGAPAVVTMNLAAQISVSRPDLSTLVTVLPLVSTTDSVLAFDGVIDFGGDSGRSHEGLFADDSDGFVTTLPADLALFTGPGPDIALPIAAVGASSGSGAGNLILQFNTSAMGGATVTYEYLGAGACCTADGSCEVLTPAACEAAEGMWQGEGTSCDPNPCDQPTGACCTAAGACEVLTASACLGVGGTYMGDGVECNPGLCGAVPAEKHSWGEVKSLYR